MRLRLRGALLWLAVFAGLFGSLILLFRAGLPHWVVFFLLITVIAGGLSIDAYRRGTLGRRFLVAMLGSYAAFVAAGFFAWPADLPLMFLAAIWPYGVLYYLRRRSASGNGERLGHRRGLVNGGWFAALLLMAGLVGMSFWLDSRGGSAQKATEGHLLQQEVQAIDQAFKQMDGTAHQVRYRVHLDRRAVATATSYVRALYVVHSCKAVPSLSKALLGPQWIASPIGNGGCSSWMKTSLGEEDYLVRGSLAVLHNCSGGLGAQLAANECVGFTVIGRYDYDTTTGVRTRHCSGEKVDVFLKQDGGRWYVVGTAATDLFGEGAPCTGSDAVLLSKRVPWE